MTPIDRSESTRADSEYMAVARCVGPTLRDGMFYDNWYVWWARKDGTAHGSRGFNMTAAAAKRLEDDINEGRETP